jgi:hypothetical protein
MFCTRINKSKAFDNREGFPFFNRRAESESDEDIRNSAVDADKILNAKFYRISNHLKPLCLCTRNK